MRLVGHAERVFLLDCGLNPAQRELVAPHATLVPAPGGTLPFLLKTIAPLGHPAETMVLIDADMIVTRPLDELIERAAEGRVVAFRTRRNRFFAEWEDLLDLRPIRRRPSVSSGLVLLGGESSMEVVRLLDDRQRRVDPELGYGYGNATDYPLMMLDRAGDHPLLARGIRLGGSCSGRALVWVVREKLKLT